MAVIVKRSVTSGETDIVAQMLDLIYPVGSYYETSDTSFDPNISWGGTWAEDTDGRVLVALDSGTFDTVGDTGGAETHSHDVGSAGAVARINLKRDGRVLTSEAQVSEWTSNFQESGMTAASVSESGQGYGASLQGDTGASSSLPPYVVVKRWHRTA